MSKIYVFAQATYDSGDVVGCALAEDGHALAGHFSSSYDWFRHDMGLTSEWKHNLYAEHYPDGYELEEVQDPRNHIGFMAAYEKNQQLAAAQQEAE